MRTASPLGFGVLSRGKVRHGDVSHGKVWADNGGKPLR